jgi:hypothetical protein
VIKFNARVRPSSSLISSSSASREASRQGDRAFFLRSPEMKRYDVGRTTGPAQSTPLQPKIVFSRFPLVHKADLKGPLRVELTRSPIHRRMTAFCAKLPYEVDPPKGSSRRKAAVAEISL